MGLTEQVASVNQPSDWKRVREVLKELKSKGDQSNVEGMARFGITPGAWAVIEALPEFFPKTA